MQQLMHFGDLKFSCSDLEIVNAVAPPSEKRCEMHAPLYDKMCGSVEQRPDNAI